MSTRKITCTITGKSYTFGKDYFDKKVKEYIDESNLKRYFITKKAKNYLNKGYSVQEIRNILNVDDENLPGADSQTAKKISNTLNFATHKSDSEVAEFINTIRDYE